MNWRIRIVITACLLLPLSGCDYIAAWLPGNKSGKKTATPVKSAPQSPDTALPVTEQILKLQQEIAAVEQEKQEMEQQRDAMREEKKALDGQLQEQEAELQRREKEINKMESAGG